MDLTFIQSWLATAIPGPWGIVAGIGVIVLYQYAKVRFPGTFAKLPNFVPLPSSPPATPASPAAPAVSATPAAADHPALNTLLNLIGSNRAVSLLVTEVQRMFAEPEPAAPIAAAPAKTI